MNPLLNPFQSQQPNQPMGALANTDQTRAIAEVQAAMMIARLNPRNQVQAMDRILNACTRLSLAEGAMYQYAKGGQEVSGPSIRLAETIAQNWGNIQFGIRELDQREGESTVQSYAWDVETNTRREATFQVLHVRVSKHSTKRLTDPRDIYEVVANQGARRLRACILAVIPGDVVEAAVIQCEATLRAKADVSPEGIMNLIESFHKIGISKEQLELRIQRRIYSIQPAQVVAARKIYTSIRDGMSKAEDWFECGKTQVPSDYAIASTNAVVEDEYTSFRAAIREVESLEDFEHLIGHLNLNELARLHTDIEQRQAEITQVA